ncbi:hypothetical protein JTB14_006152 [Gonioctena quinquepunctata]|nr:hypothetical protein JTB14_006152 [Gonioctena quinquepunctata]
MSRNSKVLQCSEHEKTAILKHYNITDTENEDIISRLKGWFLTTSIPPEYITKQRLQCFLLNSKMSIEKTKRAVIYYFRVRTEMPSYFSRFLTSSEEYDEAKSLVKSFAMPKLTPDLCRITIFRMDDYQGKAVDGFMYSLPASMSAELRAMCDDFFLSNIIIVDLEKFELKHLMKFVPVIHKIFSVIMAINWRIKHIHMIHSTTILDRVLPILRMVMPKFIDKILVHDSHESLYEYIPEEYLPSDYGGSQPSIEDTQERWWEELRKHEEDFKFLINAKCEELLENTETFEDPFGVDGSFRKLIID